MLPDVDIVGVCTRKPSDVWWGRQVVREYCEDKKIPLLRRIQLRELEYDFLISVLYPFVIEGEHIARARTLAVNLHEAPLPRWRGCNGYAHAIMEGDAMYGTTLHVLDAELDAGEVIAERSFPIDPNETVRELYERTTDYSAALFRAWLPRILSGSWTLQPKSIAPDKSFVNPRNSLTTCKDMEGHTSLQQAYHVARALDFLPWEPAFHLRGGIRYYAFIGGSSGRDISGMSPCIEIPASKTIADLDLAPGRFQAVRDTPRPMVFADADTYMRLFPLRS